MGADSDMNRKQNPSENTMLGNDDGKICGSEQLYANEHIKDKRDKSPSGLGQINNELMSGEQMDHFNKQNAERTNENAGKRSKTICYDFKKGICRRRFCRVSVNIEIQFYMSLQQY